MHRTPTIQSSAAPRLHHDHRRQLKGEGHGHRVGLLLPLLRSFVGQLCYTLVSELSFQPLFSLLPDVSINSI